MAFVTDPTEEVRMRVQQLARAAYQPPFDDKETRERQEAAEAYGREDPQHYVAFCYDCIEQSRQAMQMIRRNQRECWDVYQEKEPTTYARKELWQSRVVIPKPFAAVQFATAVVRKAFDVQFLSIEGEQDPDAATFWEKLLGLMLGRSFANFPMRFTDATCMAFAVGQSMEMLPVWRPFRGLRYTLVEPWKIYRDPDALSREPQSGMYWIHQEYLDYYLLKRWEQDGRYKNIPDYSPGTLQKAQMDENLTPEEINRRKEMAWHRSSYRSMVQTNEFWGTILDKRGQLLLESATFTIAGTNLIRAPEVSPYPGLRWPGTSYSALPHLLRFDGRGLIQGIKSLWNFMCSLLCLHVDNLNWTVNPMHEIDVSALIDRRDVEKFPGKDYLTRGTVSGQQAIRTVDRKSITNEILANINASNQMFDEGSMVQSIVKGGPGYRAEVTAREAAQALDQSLTVFSLMGSNLEDGALQAIMAGAETIEMNMTYQELAYFMGKETAQQYADPGSPTGLRLPKLTTGAFSVSGISSLMRDWEMIRNIQTVILPLFEPGSVFLPYLVPVNLLKAVEKRLNLKDEGIIISDADAKRVADAQQAEQEMGIASSQVVQEAAAQEAQAAAMAAGEQGGEVAPLSPNEEVKIPKMNIIQGGQGAQPGGST